MGAECITHNVFCDKTFIIGMAYHAPCSWFIYFPTICYYDWKDLKVIITLLLFLVFYNWVITALLNSDLNTKTVSLSCWEWYQHYVWEFWIKLFCFHWSGKEFRMFFFCAKHHTFFAHCYANIILNNICRYLIINYTSRPLIWHFCFHSTPNRGPIVQVLING